MKNTQKFFLVAMVGILIIPQITFAAWWNPLSWNIFSFIFHSNSPQVEMVSTTTAPSETSISNSPDVTQPKVTTPSKSPVKSTPKVSATVIITPPPTPVQTAQQTQPAGTLCNGTYWKECPAGQNFICPTTGNAYCQTPQQPVQPVPQKDNYQICKDTYGYATWDGSSYTSSGGPNCSCDAGYGPSSDGKSCVAVQTQQVQQPDNSISNSACQTAVQNLKDLQTSYASGFAGLSTSGTAGIASALSAIFTNQYNTELPAYQIAAQAACQVPASNIQCQSSLQKFDAFQAQYPLKQLVGMSTRGDAFAMRFTPYQTDIQYSCQ